MSDMFTYDFIGHQNGIVAQICDEGFEEVEKN